MKLSPLLAVLIAAAPASAAARALAARADAQKKAAADPAVAVSTPEAPAAAPLAADTAPPRDEAALAVFGASLSEDEDGLLACAVWPDGAAAAMGLRPGDRAWYVDRAAARTRAEAAAARRAAPPEERASLIVRRGLETLALTGPETPAPRDFVRGERELSAREKSLAAARSARDVAAARDAVVEAAPLSWVLRADQAFWVRFPDGLPSGLRAGDEVSAEAATPLTTDDSLDFLAIPPRSRVWARVISASDDGEVRSVRLAFYKMRPAGGRVYPILGAAKKLAGAPADLARVSSGGALVVAAPLPSANGKKRRGKDLLLNEDARLRVRLLDPTVLVEAPAWWRAGPGLWLKTADDANGRRRFQVTHVVPGRSAAAAGLKVGDMIESVAGRSSERLDFEEALDALYGAPGTTVKVSVSRPDGARALNLVRGVEIDAKGSLTPAPLPFAAR